MIRLDKLIKADTVKLIFPNDVGENPLDEFDKEENIKTWMFYQYPNYQFNFKEGEVVIGLVKLTKDLFVLASVEEVKEKINVIEGKGYNSITLPEYEDYRGRLIIKFENKATQLKRNFTEVCEDSEVYALLSQSEKVF